MNIEQSSEARLKELLQKEASNADKKLLMRLDQTGKIAWVEFLEVKNAKIGVDQKKINAEISSARGALNRVCTLMSDASLSAPPDTNSLVDIFSISADYLHSLDKKKQLQSGHKTEFRRYLSFHKNKIKEAVVRTWALQENPRKVGTTDQSNTHDLLRSQNLPHNKKEKKEDKLLQSLDSRGQEAWRSFVVHCKKIKNSKTREAHVSHTRTALQSVCDAIASVSPEIRKSPVDVFTVNQIFVESACKAVSRKGELVSSIRNFYKNNLNDISVEMQIWVNKSTKQLSHDQRDKKRILTWKNPNNEALVNKYLETLKLSVKYQKSIVSSLRSFEKHINEKHFLEIVNEYLPPDGKKFETFAALKKNKVDITEKHADITQKGVNYSKKSHLMNFLLWIKKDAEMDSDRASAGGSHDDVSDVRMSAEASLPSRESSVQSSSTPAPADSSSFHTELLPIAAQGQLSAAMHTLGVKLPFSIQAGSTDGHQAVPEERWQDVRGFNDCALHVIFRLDPRLQTAYENREAHPQTWESSLWTMAGHLARTRDMADKRIEYGSIHTDHLSDIMRLRGLRVIDYKILAHMSTSELLTSAWNNNQTALLATGQIPEFPSKGKKPELPATCDKSALRATGDESVKIAGHDIVTNHFTLLEGAESGWNLYDSNPRGAQAMLIPVTSQEVEDGISASTVLSSIQLVSNTQLPEQLPKLDLENDKDFLQHNPNGMMAVASRDPSLPGPSQLGRRARTDGSSNSEADPSPKRPREAYTDITRALKTVRDSAPNTDSPDIESYQYALSMFLSLKMDEPEAWTILGQDVKEKNPELVKTWEDMNQLHIARENGKGAEKEVYDMISEHGFAQTRGFHILRDSHDALQVLSNGQYQTLLTDSSRLWGSHEADTPTPDPRPRVRLKSQYTPQPPALPASPPPLRRLLASSAANRPGPPSGAQTVRDEQSTSDPRRARQGRHPTTRYESHKRGGSTHGR